MRALTFACISAQSLDRSVAFYRDVIGFDVVEDGVSQHLRAFLGVDDGPAVPWVLMRASGLPVGQILLLQCPGSEPISIREPGDRTTRGLWNLNFYVADMWRTFDALRAQGFEFWSEPVEYKVGEAGTAIEVLFDAPDGVAINLVQPLGEPETFTGRIRSSVEGVGHTRTGFSPVATTACCVHSAEASKSFFEQVLQLRVVLDEVLGKPETNRFLNRAPDARSRTLFLEGDHFFGKLSLNQPLNYAPPERMARARPENIGYFALGFRTLSLDAAVACAEALGAQTVSKHQLFDIPELGDRGRLLRVPDGPLLWLSSAADA